MRRKCIRIFFYAHLHSLNFIIFNLLNGFFNSSDYIFWHLSAVLSEVVSVQHNTAYAIRFNQIFVIKVLIYETM